jgi:hypothetical protein
MVLPKLCMYVLFRKHIIQVINLRGFEELFTRSYKLLGNVADEWLATGRWFSLVSSTNKTYRHNITILLLKMATTQSRFRQDVLYIERIYCDLRFKVKTILCTLCCQFLWIVHLWLPILYYLMFIWINQNQV